VTLSVRPAGLYLSIGMRSTKYTNAVGAAEAIGALSVFEREHSEKAARQREKGFRLFVDGVQDYAVFVSH
jgi:hypothetical protein